MEDALGRLRELDRDIRILEHIGSLLGWDQETYMPSAGLEERSLQHAVIQGLVHERKTADEIGSLLEDLGAREDRPEGDPNLSELDAAFVRAVFREYNRNTKLPSALVKKRARETSLAQRAWVEARKESDFSIFAPYLSEILKIVLEISERLGYTDHPYDPLLDEYEPMMKTAQVREVFRDLRTQLVPLFERVKEAGEIDDSPLHGRFPEKAQRDFGFFVLEKMGYDFNRGRMDKTVHPFTTTLGRDDVRITTRYDEAFFSSGFFSIVHEGGHGLYELGFKDELGHGILAQACSLGFHESQSRLWENLVGRSMPFWTYFFPLLQDRFPDALADTGLKQFYRAVNKVQPSLIRVEADELTYNLHIILRFELELKLISGELRVDELPEAWRQESRELLGIAPEKDSEGVLQDIHWSMGAVGYFPTYCLGNLYSAQIMHALRNEISDLNALMSSGSLSVVLKWLRKNVHAYGARLTPSELCRKISGDELNASYFLQYLEAKYRELYDL
jgi:carboxypeptidase Taq